MPPEPAEAPEDRQRARGCRLGTQPDSWFTPRLQAPGAARDRCGPTSEEGPWHRPGRRNPQTSRIIEVGSALPDRNRNRYRINCLRCRGAGPARLLFGRRDNRRCRNRRRGGGHGLDRRNPRCGNAGGTVPPHPQSKRSAPNRSIPVGCLASLPSIPPHWIAQSSACTSRCRVASCCAWMPGPRCRRKPFRLHRASDVGQIAGRPSVTHVMADGVSRLSTMRGPICRQQSLAARAATNMATRALIVPVWRHGRPR
jgi:hypothetical protein